MIKFEQNSGDCTLNNYIVLCLKTDFKFLNVNIPNQNKANKIDINFFVSPVLSFSYL